MLWLQNFDFNRFNNFPLNPWTTPQAQAHVSPASLLSPPLKASADRACCVAHRQTSKVKQLRDVNWSHEPKAATAGMGSGDWRVGGFVCPCLMESVVIPHIPPKREPLATSISPRPRPRRLIYLESDELLSSYNYTITCGWIIALNSIVRPSEV